MPVIGFARSENIDLVVVGPEAPLVAGVADAIRAAGIAVFGPGAQGARLEGSKSFCKGIHAGPWPSHGTLQKVHVAG